MQSKDNNIKTFFELVRAGLWEKEARLLPFGKVYYEEVMRLAEEQSVVGLVAAGLGCVSDVKVPKEELLQFVGLSLRLEQQNKDMNVFLANLVEKMRSAGIYTLLVKGQGVAQCYEKPLWRACGDIDLLLDEENYNRAKELLMPLASDVEQEYARVKHLGLTIDGWVVELHGSLRVGLSKRINRVMDDIRQDTFYGGNVRSWNNNGTQVFLLSKENDIVYVFVHFFAHFYKGGIGLRQICDWCRLLWTYRDSLDYGILESRIKKAGLISEWKAFGAFAVKYLGMPADAVPLLDVRSLKEDVRWKKKADRICSFIMEVGNMGHNRDSSYYVKYPYVIRKVFSFSRRLGDLYRHARIFPLDSFRFLPSIVFNGVRSAIKGE